MGPYVMYIWVDGFLKLRTIVMTSFVFVFLVELLHCPGLSI
jgi:hypothetical protein